MDVSVIVPVYNEEESLTPLTEWVVEVLKKENLEFEIFFIDDGSTDRSWDVIAQLKKKYGIVRAIKFRRNYGKSAALNMGFAEVTGEVVVTMDADLQDSPDELPGLIRMIRDEGYDLVSGWKKKRQDPISKTVPSKLFNYVARKASGISLHDFNCGLKAYKRQVVKDIRLYGDMHRWIPILAKWEGYTRIGEKVVEHRSRKYGISKFGPKRLISGFLDLLSIFFVGKFNKQPMHFFGTWGMIFFLAGFIILVYLTIGKLVYRISGIQDRPLFFLGILVVIIGAQLFVTGFISELVISNQTREHRYNVADHI